MRSFGRKAWIGQAWLTAVMTLLTAVPHFDCRCPDGQFKPFCVSISRDASGCCCGGTCCSSIEGGRSCCRARSRVAPEQMQTGSCCQHQDRQTNGSPGNQPEVGPRGCTRTVAPAEVLTRSPGMTTVDKDLTTEALLPQAVDVVCRPTMAGAHPCWQSHQIAPPTDLIISLQRFLI